MINHCSLVQVVKTKKCLVKIHKVTQIFYTEVTNLPLDRCRDLVSFPEDCIENCWWKAWKWNRAIFHHIL